jgi:hypothetical protein
MCKLTKKCNACLEEKELYEFHKSSRMSDGLNNKCKFCLKKKVLKNHDFKEGVKLCTYCNTEKQYSEFNKDTESKDGYDNRCRECFKNKVLNRNLIIEDGFKRCCKCEEIKSALDFGFRSHTPDNLNYSCKSCSTKAHPKEILPEGYKKCTICSEVKLYCTFYKDSKNKKDGLIASCKQCKKDYVEKRKTNVKVTHENNIKLCKKCNNEKPTCDFYLSAVTYDGLNCNCKKCIDKYYENNKERSSETSKIWRQNNLEQCRKITKVWQDNHKEYTILKNKEYREKNKEKVAVNLKAYIKNRLINDPIFKLTDSIRKSVKNSFKRNLIGKFSKNQATENILHCKPNILLLSIKSQFLSWMSLENYGNVCGDLLSYNCSWDLDHIIPISYAKTEEEVYLLNHWSNFQPLCSKVNRDEKKDRIFPCTNLELGITFWEDKYEYINKLKNNPSKTCTE